MTNPTTKEIMFAADEMLERFGDKAAMEAANWSNSALDQRDQAKYEFWQLVSMEISFRDFPQPSRSRAKH